MTKKITNPEILAVRAAAEEDPARARVWVGLDVGMKSTAVCVLDGDGKVVHQCAMKTHPTEIGRYLAKNFTSNVAVVGMETGAMSVHLSGGLRRLGYQVAVMDALQVHRVLSLKRNKTDANDARGIAEITRTGRDYLTRTHLVTAATVMLSATKTFSSLKDWGLRLAKKVGFNKAKVAVARKLAIILFGMWRDGTHFQFKAETVEPHRQMMQAARA